MPQQTPYPYVGYHAQCPDGFGASMAAKKHFGCAAKYLPLSHGEVPPELKSGADFYLLDFSFPRRVLLDLCEDHEIWVLDHHASAQAALEGIEEESRGRVHVTFDMDRSGAYLAWKHFIGEVPRLIKYVEDADLWNWNLPDSREVAAAVQSYPQDYVAWSRLLDRTRTEIPDDLVGEGRAVLRTQRQQVESLSQAARTAVFPDGSSVPAVNAPYFLSSDLGHALLNKFPDAPFSAVYRDSGTGERQWSLRSDHDRADVMQVAVLLGGGGHRNASGFQEHEAGERIQFMGKYS